MNGESKQAEHPNKADQGSTKLTMSESESGTATREPRKSEDSDAENEPKWKRRHYRVQVTIVFVGALGVIIYGFQLHEMRRSTNAATHAINLTRENAHLDQRAWVADSGVTGKAEIGKPYQITVTIKNTGKTFAKRYHSVTGFWVKQLSDPDPDFEKAVAEGYTHTSTAGIIPPNGAFEQTVEPHGGTKVTQDDLDQWNVPTVVMLVFGKIIYSDIFDCEHWTKFCYRVYANGTFQTYGSYNDADDNRCP